MSDNFKIIEGLPSEVESEINQHLNEGWSLHGTMLNRDVDGTTVVIQAVSREKMNNTLKEARMPTTHRCRLGQRSNQRPPKKMRTTFIFGD